MGQTISQRPTSYPASEGKRFAGDTRLVVVTCATCGVPYAIPASFDRAARAHPGGRPDGWSICCPFGHVWHYVVGQTELERARRERDEARDELWAEKAEHDQTRASLSATRGVVTRQRGRLERVRHGVCPCCNRTFQDLARHMATKHPDYRADADEAAEGS